MALLLLLLLLLRMALRGSCCCCCYSSSWHHRTSPQRTRMPSPAARSLSLASARGSRRVWREERIGGWSALGREGIGQHSAWPPAQAPCRSVGWLVAGDELMEAHALELIACWAAQPSPGPLSNAEIARRGCVRVPAHASRYHARVVHPIPSIPIACPTHYTRICCTHTGMKIELSNRTNHWVWPGLGSLVLSVRRQRRFLPSKESRSALSSSTRRPPGAGRLQRQPASSDACASK
jgi:hypothetical protein